MPCLNWPVTQEWEDIGTVFNHNHCRNPIIPGSKTERERVWCYTGRGNIMDFCDVPWCSNLTAKAVVEKEGIPVIRTATIILGVVSFFLVIVICLIVGNWYCSCRGNRDDKDDTIELVPTSDSVIDSS